MGVERDTAPQTQAGDPVPDRVFFASPESPVLIEVFHPATGAR